MKISAVLVTFNRLTLLQQVLKAFESLTRKPDHLIIVNNCSTDGTLDYLTEWKDKTLLDVKLVNLDENLGGSGGFHEGLKEALKTDSDWFWVSDDDAFPDSDSFELADKYLTENDTDKLGAICGTVISYDTIDITHRRRLSGKLLRKEEKVQEYEYKKEEFDVDLFSYVGTIISRKALMSLGITEKDFFIWYDDTEHSMRIASKYRIVCVPKIKVIHDTLPAIQGETSWKLYYGIRNQLITYRKHYPLTFLYIILTLFRSIISNVIKRRPYSRVRVIFFGLIHGVINKRGLDHYYYPGRKL